MVLVQDSLHTTTYKCLHATMYRSLGANLSTWFEERKVNRILTKCKVNMDPLLPTAHARAAWSIHFCLYES